MSLFGHKIKQTLVTVHDIINYISVTDCFEMFPRTMYLGFLNEPELHGGHRAFRFGNEIDCIFVNDVRPKRRKNNQVQRIVKRPAGVEREGRSEAEERPNEARRAARRGEIIAR